MKSIFRPIYRILRNNPLYQGLIRRELAALGARDWTAHILERFIHGPCGEAYGIGPAQKTDLVADFHSITGHIESGTAPVVHAILAEALLSIPPDLKGDVVECGCWKGASAASLSKVCALTNRKLFVCDSFQGLPDDGVRRHTGLHTGVYGYYIAGMFKGSLEEVRSNIRQWGSIDACTFIEGFFAESLAALNGPVVLAFLDVDLESSTRDCLQALWPLLVENALLFSDDAGDLDVVKVFFDTPWWQQRLQCTAPGFVGSGCGLPLSPAYSALGYTRKPGPFKACDWKQAPFLHYPPDADDTPAAP